MFTDPITIKVATVDKTMAKTGSALNQGEYAGPDGLRLKISHSYGKRERSVFRLDSRKIGADPLATGINKEYTASVYLVMDQPVVGYSDTDMTNLVNALLDALKVPANLSKFVGGES